MIEHEFRGSLFKAKPGFEFLGLEMNKSTKYHQIKVSTCAKPHNAVGRKPNKDYLRRCSVATISINSEGNQRCPMEQDESENVVPRANFI